MRTVNPDNTYRGLTFPQWKALLDLAETLSIVFKYLDDPLMLYRANELRMKICSRYYS